MFVNFVLFALLQEGGLGLHLTLDVQGSVRFGPDIEWITSVDYTVCAVKFCAVLAAWHMLAG